MSVRKTPAKNHGACILMVDDNVHGLTARKTVLEELGHTVTTARTGAEALEQFLQHAFDLVVTDYKMPRMTGLELIPQLRAHAPQVPLILLSGFVDALGMNEQRTGADAVIQKSANELPHLIRAVERLLNPPVKRVAKKRKPAASESKSEAPKGNRKSG